METCTRKIIVFALWKMGITKAAHLWEIKNKSWKSFEDKLKCTQGIPTKIKELVIMPLNSLQTTTIVTQDKALKPDLWKWAQGTLTNGTFSFNNQKTYLMFLNDFEEWKTLNTP